MGKNDLTKNEALELLESAPTRIISASIGLSPEQIRNRPDSEAWSMVEVLAHLRSCADQWGGAIERIVAEDEPTIRAINPRQWIKSTNYREIEFEPSFEAYSTQRDALVALLRGLTPDDWNRTATIKGAGAPLVRSVSDFAKRMAVHERPHLKQIAQIVETVKSPAI